MNIRGVTKNCDAIITSMHPDLIKLTEWLDEAAALLRQHQIENWAEWLSKDAQRVRNGDFYGIEHLRSAFGGMGSLNDLGLTVPNPGNPGHLVSSSDDQRFQWLLNQIRDMAGKLFREKS